MATITDFVVGLGFDSTDFDRGIRNAEKSLGNFKSDILQIGATLAGGFGVKSLTFGFSEQKEGIRQFAQSIGLAASSYAQLEQAADSYGASAGDLQGILSQMARDRAAMSKGEFNYTDLAITGINWGAIHSAKDDVEAFVALAGQWQKLSRSQRINTAAYYGLSPQMIDLLSQGRKGVKELMETFGEARPYTDDMGKSAREFSKQWAILSSNIGGFADRVATPFIKDVTDIITVINEWTDANREWLSSGADEIGEHFAVFAAAIAAFPLVKLAGLVGYLGKLAGLGGAIKSLGRGVLAIGRGLPLIAGATIGVGLSQHVKDKAEAMDKFEDLNGDGVIDGKEKAAHYRKLYQDRGVDVPPELEAQLQALESGKIKNVDIKTQKPNNPNQGKKTLGIDKKEKNSNIAPTLENKDGERKAAKVSQDGNKTLIINNYIDTPAFSRMVIDLDEENWEAAEQQSKSTTDR